MPLAIQKGGGIRRNHTTVTDCNNIVLVTLYNTPIFEWDRNQQIVTLNTGGHNTPTTIRRMNECLHHYNFALRVCKADFAYPQSRRSIGQEFAAMEHHL